MSYTLFHNPRCRKSREALQILQEKGIEPEIRLYLQDPPGVDELKDLAQMLGRGPHELMRTGETVYKEMVKGKDLDEESLFDVMAQHPILLERPVLIRDGKEAVIGRPPEEVLKLI